MKRIKSPITIQFEVTPSCPLKCRYCYNSWRSTTNNKNNSQKISLRNAEIIIKKIIDAEIPCLVITGGEPLENFPVVLRSLKMCAGHPIIVNLNSNLVLLTKKRASVLKELGLTGILTSISGPNETVHDSITQKKGSFRRLIKGINIARDAGIKVQANMVVSKLNFKYIKETATFLKNMGFDLFLGSRVGLSGNESDFSKLQLNREEMISYLNDMCWVNTELNMKIDILEPIPFCGMKEVKDISLFSKRSCAAGNFTMTVSYDGSVKPCSRLNNFYGNMINEDLSVIWKRMESWSEKTQIPPDCLDCSLLKKCNSGCRMEAEASSGMINGLDPYTKIADKEHCVNVIKKISLKEPSQAELSSMWKLDNFTLRDESFGGIAIFSNLRIVFLDQNGFKVFKQLKPNTGYSILDKNVDWSTINYEMFLKTLLQRRVARVTNN